MWFHLALLQIEHMPNLSFDGFSIELNYVTANYINSIEIVRRQLLDLKFMLSNTDQKEELISLVDSLESDFLNLEINLIQLSMSLFS